MHIATRWRPALLPWRCQSPPVNKEVTPLLIPVSMAWFQKLVFVANDRDIYAGSLFIVAAQILLLDILGASAFAKRVKAPSQSCWMFVQGS